MEKLGDVIDFSKPGTGICCGISVTSISNVVSNTLGQTDKNLEIGSEVMPATSEHQFHLIVSIVNNGFFEHAMEAAKEAGATGGTLIHARGLGSKEAVKYLGITIEPEKDLILIVAPRRKSGPSWKASPKLLGLPLPAAASVFPCPSITSPALAPASTILIRSRA